MRIALASVVVVLLAVAGFLIWAHEPAIDPATPPSAAAFPPERIATGAQLAAVGNCQTCHTAQDGASYAGGRGLETPFGMVFSTNITPDTETGIGAWSEAAFRRAMREGIARDGRHLFPAFPYTHFTRLTDGDIAALYAFVMTRTPVSAQNRPSEIPLPRALMAGWNLLYLDRTPFQPVADRSPEWNRGAYLAQGLAHCGACHTPRDALGALRASAAYSGATLQGWHAPALTEGMLAPVPWTEAQIDVFLRTGYSRLHGAAAGPMAEVTLNLARAPETEVAAIATYVASLSDQAVAERERRIAGRVAFAEAREAEVGGPIAAPLALTYPGAEVFAGACAHCHHKGGDSPAFRPVPLGLSTALNAAEPRNAIKIVLGGLHPPAGEAGPMMPEFADALTDVQLADLLVFLRAEFTDRPPWSGIADQIRTARQDMEKSQ